MKGIALEITLFRSLSVLSRLLVEIGDPLECGHNVRPECLPVLDRFGREEAPPQDFSDILLNHGLHSLLALAAEDGVELVCERLAELVALGWISRQQRRHDRAGIDLRRRLRQVLEEVDQPAAPRGVESDLSPRVHENLVDENEGRETLLAGHPEQLDEQVLGRGALPLRVLAFGTQELQPFSAGNLEGEHAPRVLQPPRLPVRPADLHSLLDVELVEG